MPIAHGYGVDASIARRPSAAGAAPNLAVYCPLAYENLTGWVPQFGTSEQIRTPGQPDPCGGIDAVTVTDASATDYHGLRKSFVIPSGTQAYEFRALVEKDPAATHVSEFQFRFGTLENRVEFRVSDGSTNLPGGRERTVTVTEELDGWWTVKIDVTNNNNGSCDVYIWPGLGQNFEDFAASGTGSMTLHGVTFGLPTYTNFTHVLYYGQSNSVPRGTPLMTPASLLIGSQQQFAGGIQPTYTQDPGNWAGDDTIAVAAASLASREFIDPSEINREHLSLAVAQALGETAPARAYLHSSHGINGKAYADLQKGTTPYANMTAAQGALPPGRVTETVVVFVHGESDWNNAGYGADLAAFEADLAADFVNVRLLLTQMNNWSTLTTETGMAPATLAQLAFAEAGGAQMLCPTYFFPYEADGLHFGAYGQRIVGEKLAEAIQTAPGSWSALRPTSVTATDNTITLAFTGRIGSLQFNVYDVNTNPNGVSDPGNYGFSLDDPGGAVITDVAISAGGATVEITSDQPVQAGAVLGYANEVPSPGVVAGYLTGPRGCLSDSDPHAPSAELQQRRQGAPLSQSAANAAAPLVNWCVAFEKTITIA